MRMLLLAVIAAICMGAEIQGPMPAEDGETCVVCYGRCNRQDVAYMVDGQRFAVMKPLEADFLQDPERYVRAYKPNTMQFTGGQPQGMSDGYLLAGLLTLLGLIISGFLAHQLILRRSDPAAVPPGLGKVPSTKMPVVCAACGGGNHPAARQCSFCGAQLTPSVESEVRR